MRMKKARQRDKEDTKMRKEHLFFFIRNILKKTKLIDMSKPLFKKPRKTKFESSLY